MISVSAIRSQVDHRRCGNRLEENMKTSFKPVDQAKALQELLRPRSKVMLTEQGLIMYFLSTHRLKSGFIVPAIFRISVGARLRPKH